MVSVLNSIDTGHEDLIHDAQMDFYGLRMATCSSDHSVKVFDVKDGNQTLTADLKGHYGPVWQVAWSHPKYGNLLATCSYDRKVIIWKESGTWSILYEYTGHESSVNSIAWAPHEYGLILACGSSDGSLSILSSNSDTGTWEAKKIPNAHTIGCNAVSWCPSTAPNPLFDASASGKPAVNTKRLASGGCDNLVKIWKEEGDRWVEESKLEMHSDWVRDVAWAPSIGLPKSVIASCSQDRRVVIWYSDDYVTWNPTVLHTFDDVVWNVSWSLIGNILAVSCGDNKVSLWKESPEGLWVSISEIAKGQAQMVGNEQRAL
ncbi:protein SEC13 homolog [Schistocerca piceifrons]|uniref:protein SEC13 homolog n=1 Tax=Schistocerca piceifrons TaxID=274613 RepID=UPI001F5E9BC4|nr:protein SEC13 homolog [Schistocerca piceifrons]XP_049812185.1 protein SEC13 homolog [Schistocerca nitens]XP_049960269.1 protein SEC13 homolog [Schistocerca serialis cubense]